MVWDVLTSGAMLWGLFFAIVGVVFWSVGFVIADYVWKHYRGDDDAWAEG